jgi:hypothetical protein
VGRWACYTTIAALVFPAVAPAAAAAVAALFVKPPGNTRQLRVACCYYCIDSLHLSRIIICFSLFHHTGRSGLLGRA